MSVQELVDRFSDPLADQTDTPQQVLTQMYNLYISNADNRTEEGYSMLLRFLDMSEVKAALEGTDKNAVQFCNDAIKCLVLASDDPDRLSGTGNRLPRALLERAINLLDNSLFSNEIALSSLSLIMNSVKKLQYWPRGIRQLLNKSLSISISELKEFNENLELILSKLTNSFSCIPLVLQNTPLLSPPHPNAAPSPWLSSDLPNVYTTICDRALEILHLFTPFSRILSSTTPLMYNTPSPIESPPNTPNPWLLKLKHTLIKERKLRQEFCSLIHELAKLYKSIFLPEQNNIISDMLLSQDNNNMIERCGNCFLNMIYFLTEIGGPIALRLHLLEMFSTISKKKAGFFTTWCLEKLMSINTSSNNASLLQISGGESKGLALCVTILYDFLDTSNVSGGSGGTTGGTVRASGGVGRAAGNQGSISSSNILTRLGNITIEQFIGSLLTLAEHPSIEERYLYKCCDVLHFLSKLKNTSGNQPSGGAGYYPTSCIQGAQHLFQLVEDRTQSILLLSKQALGLIDGWENVLCELPLVHDNVEGGFITILPSASSSSFPSIPDSKLHRPSYCAFDSKPLSITDLYIRLCYAREALQWMTRSAHNLVILLSHNVSSSNSNTSSSAVCGRAPFALSENNLSNICSFLRTGLQAAHLLTIALTTTHSMLWISNNPHVLNRGGSGLWMLHSLPCSVVNIGNHSVCYQDNQPSGICARQNGLISFSELSVKIAVQYLGLIIQVLHPKDISELLFREGEMFLDMYSKNPMIMKSFFSFWLDAKNSKERTWKPLLEYLLDWLISNVPLLGGADGGGTCATALAISNEEYWMEKKQWVEDSLNKMACVTKKKDSNGESAEVEEEQKKRFSGRGRGKRGSRAQTTGGGEGRKIVVAEKEEAAEPGFRQEKDIMGRIEKQFGMMDTPLNRARTFFAMDSNTDITVANYDARTFDGSSNQLWISQDCHFSTRKKKKINELHHGFFDYSKAIEGNATIIEMKKAFDGINDFSGLVNRQNKSGKLNSRRIQTINSTLTQHLNGISMKSDVGLIREDILDDICYNKEFGGEDTMTPNLSLRSFNFDSDVEESYALLNDSQSTTNYEKDIESNESGIFSRRDVDMDNESGDEFYNAKCSDTYRNAHEMCNDKDCIYCRGDTMKKNGELTINKLLRMNELTSVKNHLSPNVRQWITEMAHQSQTMTNYSRNLLKTPMCGLPKTHTIMLVAQLIFAHPYIPRLIPSRIRSMKKDMVVTTEDYSRFLSSMNVRELIYACDEVLYPRIRKLVESLITTAMLTHVPIDALTILRLVLTYIDKPPTEIASMLSNRPDFFTPLLSIISWLAETVAAQTIDCPSAIREQWLRVILFLPSRLRNNLFHHPEFPSILARSLTCRDADTLSEAISVLEHFAEEVSTSSSSSATGGTSTLPNSATSLLSLLAGPGLCSSQIGGSNDNRSPLLQNIMHILQQCAGGIVSGGSGSGGGSGGGASGNAGSGPSVSGSGSHPMNSSVVALNNSFRSRITRRIVRLLGKLGSTARALLLDPPIILPGVSYRHHFPLIAAFPSTSLFLEDEQRLKDDQLKDFVSNAVASSEQTCSLALLSWDIPAMFALYTLECGVCSEFVVRNINVSTSLLSQSEPSWQSQCDSALPSATEIASWGSGASYNYSRMQHYIAAYGPGALFSGRGAWPDGGSNALHPLTEAGEAAFSVLKRAILTFFSPLNVSPEIIQNDLLDWVNRLASESNPISHNFVPSSIDTASSNIASGDNTDSVGTSRGRSLRSKTRNQSLQQPTEEDPKQSVSNLPFLISKWFYSDIQSSTGQRNHETRIAEDVMLFDLIRGLCSTVTMVWVGKKVNAAARRLLEELAVFCGVALGSRGLISNTAIPGISRASEKPLLSILLGFIKSIDAHPMYNARSAAALHGINIVLSCISIVCGEKMSDSLMGQEILRIIIAACEPIGWRDKAAGILTLISAIQHLPRKWVIRNAASLFNALCCAGTSGLPQTGMTTQQPTLYLNTCTQLVQRLSSEALILLCQCVFTDIPFDDALITISKLGSLSDINVHSLLESVLANISSCSTSKDTRKRSRYSFVELAAVGGHRLNDEVLSAVFNLDSTRSEDSFTLDDTETEDKKLILYALEELVKVATIKFICWSPEPRRLSFNLLQNCSKLLSVSIGHLLSTVQIVNWPFSSMQKFMGLSSMQQSGMARPATSISASDMEEPYEFLTIPPAELLKPVDKTKLTPCVRWLISSLNNAIQVLPVFANGPTAFPAHFMLLESVLLLCSIRIPSCQSVREEPLSLLFLSARIAIDSLLQLFNGVCVAQHVANVIAFTTPVDEDSVSLASAESTILSQLPLSTNPSGSLAGGSSSSAGGSSSQMQSNPSLILNTPTYQELSNRGATALKALKAMLTNPMWCGVLDSAFVVKSANVGSSNTLLNISTNSMAGAGAQLLNASSSFNSSTPSRAISSPILLSIILLSLHCESPGISLTSQECLRTIISNKRVSQRLLQLALNSETIGSAALNQSSTMADYLRILGGRVVQETFEVISMGGAVAKSAAAVMGTAIPVSPNAAASVIVSSIISSPTYLSSLSRLLKINPTIAPVGSLSKLLYYKIEQCIPEAAHWSSQSHIASTLRLAWLVVNGARPSEVPSIIGALLGDIAQLSEPCSREGLVDIIKGTSSALPLKANPILPSLLLLACKLPKESLEFLLSRVYFARHAEALQCMFQSKLTNHLKLETYRMKVQQAYSGDNVPSPTDSLIDFKSRNCTSTTKKSMSTLLLNLVTFCPQGALGEFCLMKLLQLGKAEGKVMFFATDNDFSMSMKSGGTRTSTSQIQTTVSFVESLLDNVYHPSLDSLILSNHCMQSNVNNAAVSCGISNNSITHNLPPTDDIRALPRQPGVLRAIINSILVLLRHSSVAVLKCWCLLNESMLEKNIDTQKKLINQAWDLLGVSALCVNQPGIFSISDDIEWEFRKLRFTLESIHYLRAKLHLSLSWTLDTRCNRYDWNIASAGMNMFLESMSAMDAEAIIKQFIIFCNSADVPIISHVSSIAMIRGCTPSLLTTMINSIVVPTVERIFRLNQITGTTLICLEQLLSVLNDISLEYPDINHTGLAQLCMIIGSQLNKFGSSHSLRQIILSIIQRFISSSKTNTATPLEALMLSLRNSMKNTLLDHSASRKDESNHMVLFLVSLVSLPSHSEMEELSPATMQSLSECIVMAFSLPVDACVMLDLHKALQKLLLVCHEARHAVYIGIADMLSMPGGASTISSADILHRRNFLSHILDALLSSQSTVTAELLPYLCKLIHGIVNYTHLVFEVSARNNSDKECSHLLEPFFRFILLLSHSARSNLRTEKQIEQWTKAIGKLASSTNNAMRKWEKYISKPLEYFCINSINANQSSQVEDDGSITMKDARKSSVFDILINSGFYNIVELLIKTLMNVSLTEIHEPYCSIARYQSWKAFGELARTVKPFDAMKIVGKATDMFNNKLAKCLAQFEDELQMCEVGISGGSGGNANVPPRQMVSSLFESMTVRPKELNRLSDCIHYFITTAVSIANHDDFVNNSSSWRDVMKILFDNTSGTLHRPNAVSAVSLAVFNRLIHEIPLPSTPQELLHPSTTESQSLVSSPVHTSEQQDFSARKPSPGQHSFWRIAVDIMDSIRNANSLHHQGVKSESKPDVTNTPIVPGLLVCIRAVSVLLNKKTPYKTIKGEEFSPHLWFDAFSRQLLAALQRISSGLDQVSAASTSDSLAKSSPIKHPLVGACPKKLLMASRANAAGLFGFQVETLENANRVVNRVIVTTSVIALSELFVLFSCYSSRLSHRDIVIVINAAQQFTRRLSFFSDVDPLIIHRCVRSILLFTARTICKDSRFGWIYSPPPSPAMISTNEEKVVQEILPAFIGPAWVKALKSNTVDEVIKNSLAMATLIGTPECVDEFTIATGNGETLVETFNVDDGLSLPVPKIVTCGLIAHYHLANADKIEHKDDEKISFITMLEDRHRMLYAVLKVCMEVGSLESSMIYIPAATCTALWDTVYLLATYAMFGSGGFGVVSIVRHVDMIDTEQQDDVDSDSEKKGTSTVLDEMKSTTLNNMRTLLAQGGLFHSEVAVRKLSLIALSYLLPSSLPSRLASILEVRIWGDENGCRNSPATAILDLLVSALPSALPIISPPGFATFPGVVPTPILRSLQTILPPSSNNTSDRSTSTNDQALNILGSHVANSSLVNAVSGLMHNGSNTLREWFATASTLWNNHEALASLCFTQLFVSIWPILGDKHRDLVLARCLNFILVDAASSRMKGVTNTNSSSNQNSIPSGNTSAPALKFSRVLFEALLLLSNPIPTLPASALYVCAKSLGCVPSLVSWLNARIVSTPLACGSSLVATLDKEVLVKCSKEIKRGRKKVERRGGRRRKVVSDISDMEDESDRDNINNQSVDDDDGNVSADTATDDQHTSTGGNIQPSAQASWEWTSEEEELRLSTSALVRCYSLLDVNELALGVRRLRCHTQITNKAISHLLVDNWTSAQADIHSALEYANDTRYTIDTEEQREEIDVWLSCWRNVSQELGQWNSLTFRNSNSSSNNLCALPTDEYATSSSRIAQSHAVSLSLAHKLGTETAKPFLNAAVASFLDATKESKIDESRLSNSLEEIFRSIFRDSLSLPLLPSSSWQTLLVRCQQSSELFEGLELLRQVRITCNELSADALRVSQQQQQLLQVEPTLSNPADLQQHQSQLLSVNNASDRIYRQAKSILSDVQERLTVWRSRIPGNWESFTCWTDVMRLRVLVFEAIDSTIIKFSKSAATTPPLIRLDVAPFLHDRVWAILRLASQSRKREGLAAQARVLLNHLHTESHLNSPAYISDNPIFVLENAKLLSKYKSTRPLALSLAQAAAPEKGNESLIASLNNLKAKILLEDVNTGNLPYQLKVEAAAAEALIKSQSLAPLMGKTWLLWGIISERLYLHKRFAKSNLYTSMVNSAKGPAIATSGSGSVVVLDPSSAVASTAGPTKTEATKNTVEDVELALSASASYTLAASLLYEKPVYRLLPARALWLLCEAGSDDSTSEFSIPTNVNDSSTMKLPVYSLRLLPPQGWISLSHSLVRAIMQPPHIRRNLNRIAEIIGRLARHCPGAIVSVARAYRRTNSNTSSLLCNQYELRKELRTASSANSQGSHNQRNLSMLWNIMLSQFVEKPPEGSILWSDLFYDTLIASLQPNSVESAINLLSTCRSGLSLLPLDANTPSVIQECVLLAVGRLKSAYAPYIISNGIGSADSISSRANIPTESSYISSTIFPSHSINNVPASIPICPPTLAKAIHYLVNNSDIGINNLISLSHNVNEAIATISRWQFELEKLVSIFGPSSNKFTTAGGINQMSLSSVSRVLCEVSLLADLRIVAHQSTRRQDPAGNIPGAGQSNIKINTTVSGNDEQNKNNPFGSISSSGSDPSWVCGVGNSFSQVVRVLPFITLVKHNSLLLRRISVLTATGQIIPHVLVPKTIEEWESDYSMTQLQQNLNLLVISDSLSKKRAIKAPSDGNNSLCVHPYWAIEHCNTPSFSLQEAWTSYCQNLAEVAPVASLSDSTSAPSTNGIHTLSNEDLVIPHPSAPDIALRAAFLRIQEHCENDPVMLKVEKSIALTSVADMFVSSYILSNHSQATVTLAPSNPLPSRKVKISHVGISNDIKLEQEKTFTKQLGAQLAFGHMMDALPSESHQVVVRPSHMSVVLRNLKPAYEKYCWNKQEYNRMIANEVPNTFLSSLLKEKTPKKKEINIKPTVQKRKLTSLYEEKEEENAYEQAESLLLSSLSSKVPFRLTTNIQQLIGGVVPLISSLPSYMSVYAKALMHSGINSLVSSSLLLLHLSDSLLLTRYAGAVVRHYAETYQAYDRVVPTTENMDAAEQCIRKSDMSYVSSIVSNKPQLEQIAILVEQHEAVIHKIVTTVCEKRAFDESSYIDNCMENQPDLDEALRDHLMNSKEVQDIISFNMNRIASLSSSPKDTDTPLTCYEHVTTSVIHREALLASRKTFARLYWMAGGYVIKDEDSKMLTDILMGNNTVSKPETLEKKGGEKKISTAEDKDKMTDSEDDEDIKMQEMKADEEEAHVPMKPMMNDYSSSYTGFYAEALPFTKCPSYSLPPSLLHESLADLTELSYVESIINTATNPVNLAQLPFCYEPWL